MARPPCSIRLGAPPDFSDTGLSMRIPCLLLGAWLLLGALAHADDQLVQRFDGHNSLTTADFTVPDGWEIRWHSNQVLSLGVIRRDNTVVAGTTGRNIGSLYMPQGGTFRIRVKGEDPIVWDVAVYALDKTAPPDDTASDYYFPTDGPAFKPIADVPVTNPPPVAPEVVPVLPPAPPPLPTQLSADQLHCMVVIKGDRTQGTGFFIKLGGEKVIMTAQQVIANNPNWKVLSSNGVVVQVTKIDGATDRDVATLSVKDFGFPALEPGDSSAVLVGDTVLTGASDGSIFPAAAVTAVTPQRIDIDQLHALPGCPVVLARTGQVVGVVSSAPQVTNLDHFTEQRFDERDSASARSTAAFALRFDDLPGREPLDVVRLRTQALFLDAFHEQSRMLDAYLNGVGSRDRHLWQDDDKLKSAQEEYKQRAADGDPGERTDALHGLLFELGLETDVDLDQAQQPSNFYSFPGQRAKQEVAYRQALKGQLDYYNSDVSRFSFTAIRNN